MIAFKVETEQEDDGRWLAEVVELPGVLAYGETQEAALSKVQALALRVIAERLEHGEAGPTLAPRAPLNCGRPRIMRARRHPE